MLFWSTCLMYAWELANGMRLESNSTGLDPEQLQERKSEVKMGGRLRPRF